MAGGVDAEQARAGEEEAAREEQHAGRHAEEHEKEPLGGRQVVVLHHEIGVVRRVEAGEARGRRVVPPVLISIDY